MASRTPNKASLRILCVTKKRWNLSWETEESHLLDPFFSSTAKTVSTYLLIMCFRPEPRYSGLPFWRYTSKVQDVVFSTVLALVSLFPSSWHSALWGWSNVKSLLCHMSLHPRNRKSRANTWTKPKREKTQLSSSDLKQSLSNDYKSVWIWAKIFTCT